MNFASVGLDASTVAAQVGASTRSAFVSDIYQISVASANFTDRGVDICFGYSQSGSDLSDIAVHRFINGAWTAVTGQQSIDAVTGKVCVRVADFSGAAVASLEARTNSMHARFDGDRYHVQTKYHPLAGAGGSGSFAILKPSVVQTGGTHTEASIKVYNFPNPFDLNYKTVDLDNATAGGATDPFPTWGTVIKVAVPTGVAAGTQGQLRIYNLAGELVREIGMGAVTGGKYTYLDWNGRNKDGEQVANGVYYGIVILPGVKAKDGTFKMAVIK